ncbi:HIT family protein [Halostella litorea]|uniref:HIT family protein n=1 Tax=Halostella litorea TaxID=2528831 RepID=UPI001092CC68|nr:HIT family protein [Halostella litorea]
MSDCIFCQIGTGEGQVHRIYEDERTLAFLDVAPANPGHTLVIPTAHHETLTEMADSLVASVFQTVRRVADAIESAYDPDGVNIIQSNGAAAGQEVFHAHVHVVPRYADDEVTLHWTPDDSSKPTNQEIAATIRHEL